MKINYVESKSKNEPKKIDTDSSPNYVFVRECIKETEDGYFEYQEAIMTKDEYLYATCNNIDFSYPQVHYEQKLNDSVVYPVTGFSYKPAYAASFYADLIAKGMAFPEVFPIKIYDVTHKEENAVSMTITELTQLAMFLATKQEQYFQEMQAEKAID